MKLGIMILRVLAFFIDCVLLNILVVSLHDWMDLPSTVEVVGVEMLLIFLILIIQYWKFGRTIGMTFCSLKVLYSEGHTFLRKICLLFPFLVYYGISFIRYLNDLIAGNPLNGHWLMAQTDGVTINGFRELQIALILIFLAALAVPRFNGRNETGWELLGKYRVVRD